MYAHEVIQDIQNLLLRFRNGAPTEMQDYLAALNEMCPLIRDAQKFHMGEVSDLEHLSAPYEGRLAFMENPEYLRLPYPVTWFDYSFSNSAKAISCGREGVPRIINSKEAALVCELGSPTFLSASFFSYIKELAAWVPAEFCAFISIGGCRGHNLSILNNLFSGKVPPEADGTVSAAWYVSVPEDHKEHMIMREYNLNFRLLEATLRVLNCKNIRASKIPAPDKLNKKRGRTGKTPVFAYHVLDVVRPGQTLSRPPGVTGGGAIQRAHLCRGHIKHYAKDAPLLGKHVGAFWWEPHLRGHGNGAVEKEYNVRLKKNGK